MERPAGPPAQRDSESVKRRTRATEAHSRRRRGGHLPEPAERKTDDDTPTEKDGRRGRGGMLRSIWWAMGTSPQNGRGFSHARGTRIVTLYTIMTVVLSLSFRATADESAISDGENAMRKLLEMWNLKLHRMNGNDRVL